MNDHINQLENLERQQAAFTGSCLTALQPVIGDPLRWMEGESDGNRVLAGVRKLAEEVERLKGELESSQRNYKALDKSFEKLGKEHLERCAQIANLTRERDAKPQTDTRQRLIDWLENPSGAGTVEDRADAILRVVGDGEQCEGCPCCEVWKRYEKLASLEAYRAPFVGDGRVLEAGIYVWRENNKPEVVHSFVADGSHVACCWCEYKFIGPLPNWGVE